VIVRVKDYRGAVVFEADMPEANVVVGAERGTIAQTGGELAEHVGLRVYDHAVIFDYGEHGRSTADITLLTIPRKSS
jgi:hypothetical protein